MKRVLLYSLAAIAMGLLLTIAPPLAIAGLEAKNDFVLSPRAFSNSFGALEGGTYTMDTPRVSIGDVESFALSFAVAIIAYVMFKRRTHIDYYD